MKNLNKKGLSGIVMTLLLILLAIFVLGVFWVVVANFVLLGTDEVSLQGLLIRMDIKRVEFDTEGIAVLVQRLPGGGELEGIRFVVLDERTSKIIDRKGVSLGDLETRRFSFSASELEGLGSIKEISIAPIYLSGLGREMIGDIVDTTEVSLRRLFLNMDAFAWWSFEGDVEDGIGQHHGELFGNVSYIEGLTGEGIYIEGQEPGRNGVILMSSEDAKKYDGSFSYSLWFKAEKVNPPNMGAVILSKSCDDYYCLRIRQNNQDTHDLFHLYHEDEQSNFISADSEEWNHVVGIWDFGNGSFQFYLNGERVHHGESDKFDFSIDMPIVLGGEAEREDGEDKVAANNFVGTIDEVLFFDRPLTRGEVKLLYGFFKT